MGRQQPDEARLGDPGAEGWPSPERAPSKCCIFHSGRGSQYCSRDCQTILREHAFPASVGGKGNCYDNAAVLRQENSPSDYFLTFLTFFKTIKAWLIWRMSWETRRQAETAIFQYINRPMSHAVGLQHREEKSPFAFKRKVAQTNTRSGTKPRQDQCKGSCRTMVALNAALALLAS